MKFLIGLVVVTFALAALFTLSGCGPSDADVAAKNVSKAAEQFEVARKIVFFNGITDKYLLEIDGYCSVETANSGLSGAISVVCKTGTDKKGNPLVKKSYMGLSDNVSYLVEQIDPIGVSATHYRVIFKPEAIVPNFDRP